MVEAGCGHWEPHRDCGCCLSQGLGLRFERFLWSGTRDLGIVGLGVQIQFYSV